MKWRVHSFVPDNDLEKAHNEEGWSWNYVFINQDEIEDDSSDGDQEDWRTKSDTKVRPQKSLFWGNCLNLVISIPCSIFCDGQSACILRRNVIGNESVF